MLPRFVVSTSVYRILIIEVMKKYKYITVRNIIRRASLVVRLKADIIAGNSLMSLVVRN